MTAPPEAASRSDGVPCSDPAPEQPRRGPVIFGLVCVVLLVVAAPWLRDRLAPAAIYVQEPGHEITGHRYLYDKTLGWRNIPDWSATTYGHKLTINSLGMRDREYERQKPAGRKRILVLGGSYTWGYGVADGENYTDVLESLLDRENGDDYQVLNTGVSGWGTKLTCQASEEELAISILRRMAAECQEYGCPLVVMKFGAFFFRHKPEAIGFRKLQRSLDEREAIFNDALSGYPGLWLFDLDEAFEKRNLDLNAILEGNHDDHWNPSGHRQAGELLFAWLAEQKLIE